MNYKSKNENVDLWIKKNLKNYLKTNPENVTEIEHIIDYLESDDAPKRLGRMSYQEAYVGAEKWTKRMINRAELSEEIGDDVEVVKKFDDNYYIVKLISQRSYGREGKLMNHCVSSYAGRDCVIYSLRDEKNFPHATIELTDGSINQIKGNSNLQVKPMYSKKVLEFLKEINVPIREGELKNLGYISLPPVMEEITINAFKNYEVLEISNKKYYNTDKCELISGTIDDNIHISIAAHKKYA